jgi:cobyrinic acid a,c-diamide synthase
MSILPRLAVGTIQPEADLQPIVWGLLDALEQDGVRTQTFLSRSYFLPCDGAAAISSNTPRHLDSWLMTPELCRQSFLRTAATAELAIVEGRYDQAVLNQRAALSEPLSGLAAIKGGSLDTLCQWLDLPRIAVVDTKLLNHCQLPPRPTADRLLLDRVHDQCDFYRWQTILESLWGIPVVGGLDECTQLRQQIAALPGGSKPPRDWCDALGERWRRYSCLQRVMQLATQPGMPADWSTTSTPDEQHLPPRSNVRVSVAYDEAFHCYFRDTLDMLELRGATVRVFSPLRDECLPTNTDIVYLGCGSPLAHAAALAENHCMLMALKEHVCSGKRIYAEGGGLAYLCQHVESADGIRTPMVGALRATARRNPVRSQPEPVEITLASESWLGPVGTKLRGYRNTNWLLEPTGCLTRLAQEQDSEFDLVGRHQAIGSRIHLNFAAQPTLLGGFLRACPAALAWGQTK